MTKKWRKWRFLTPPEIGPSAKNRTGRKKVVSFCDFPEKGHGVFAKMTKNAKFDFLGTKTHKGLKKALKCAQKLMKNHEKITLPKSMTRGVRKILKKPHFWPKPAKTPPKVGPKTAQKPPKNGQKSRKFAKIHGQKLNPRRLFTKNCTKHIFLQCAFWSLFESLMGPKRSQKWPKSRIFDDFWRASFRHQRADVPKSGPRKSIRFQKISKTRCKKGHLLRSFEPPLRKNGFWPKNFWPIFGRFFAFFLIFSKTPHFWPLLGPRQALAVVRSYTILVYSLTPSMVSSTRIPLYLYTHTSIPYPLYPALPCSYPPSLSLVE